MLRRQEGGDNGDLFGTANLAKTDPAVLMSGFPGSRAMNLVRATIPPCSKLRGGFGTTRTSAADVMLMMRPPAPSSMRQAAAWHP
jgi:hypothetical protein